MEKARKREEPRRIHTLKCHFTEAIQKPAIKLEY